MKNSLDNIIERFNSDFDNTVKRLFNDYYTELCRKAYRIVNNKEISEDIVQDVFFKLWDKRNKIVITKSLGTYLNRMVFNESISFLRKNKSFLEFSDEIEQTATNTESDNKIEHDELKSIINSAINELPARCKTIFLLSRIDELTYKQIAEQLEISVKTVENQMGKALKILRKTLRYDYLLFLIYFSL